MTRNEVATWAALASLAAATVTKQTGFWGPLFFFWSVRSLLQERVSLLNGIARARSPAIFWSITVFWSGFGIACLSDAPV